MASPANSSKLRVVIAGGGYAGLTFALALQKANIDFKILEARDTLTPNLGASIGLMPNGCRILDQLDCLDDIYELVEPTVVTTAYRADGRIIGEDSDLLSLFANRSGYPVAFLPRQWVLGLMEKRIKEPEWIVLGAKVAKIESNQDGARVHCANGKTYDCDIVVGADGAFSACRREMWRHADEAGDGELFEKDKRGLQAHYRCFFGISGPTKGIESGTSATVHDTHLSSLVFGGKDGAVYWFLFEKLDRPYRQPEPIPRFSEQDKEDLVKKHGSFLMHGVGPTLQSLYATCTSSSLTCIEEGKFKQWTYGRIVCMGDSVHKVTPNIGAGGNAAIEDAAALANSLYKLVQHNEDPSLKDVEGALKRFQKARLRRMLRLVNFANQVTRIQALDGAFSRYLTLYLVPFLGDAMGEELSKYFAAAEMIEYLPPPQRSLNVPLPFNPQQIWGDEGWKARALLAFPIFVLSLVSIFMSPKINRDSTDAMLANAGSLVHASFRGAFTMLSGVKLWAPFEEVLYATLQGGTGDSWWGLSSLFDDITLYTIWLIESTRRANFLKLTMLPVVWGLLAHRFGVGLVGPIYFSILYITSPVEAFRSSDHRLSNLQYTKSILPLVLLFMAAPAAIAHAAPDLTVKQWALYTFQLSPLLISVGQYFSKKVIISDTQKQDRMKSQKRDLPLLYVIAATAALLSAATRLSPRFEYVSKAQSFLVPPLKPTDVYDTIINKLQWNAFCGVGSALVWLFLSLLDLKDAGMLRVSWAPIVLASLISVAILGPASTFAFGWCFREYILANRRHKGAITAESIRRAEQKGGKVKALVANGKA